jgi:hypothetical protein
VKNIVSFLLFAGFIAVLASMPRSEQEQDSSAPAPTAFETGRQNMGREGGGSVQAANCVNLDDPRPAAGRTRVDCAAEPQSSLKVPNRTGAGE